MSDLKMVHVRYVGNAPAVVGPEGLEFPHGELVEVPAELASMLGPSFKIVTKSKKGDS